MAAIISPAGPRAPAGPQRSGPPAGCASAVLSELSVPAGSLSHIADHTVRGVHMRRGSLDRVYSRFSLTDCVLLHTDLSHCVAVGVTAHQSVLRRAPRTRRTAARDPRHPRTVSPSRTVQRDQAFTVQEVDSRTASAPSPVHAFAHCRRLPERGRRRGHGRTSNDTSATLPTAGVCRFAWRASTTSRPACKAPGSPHAKTRTLPPASAG